MRAILLLVTTLVGNIAFQISVAIWPEKLAHYGWAVKYLWMAWAVGLLVWAITHEKVLGARLKRWFRVEDKFKKIQAETGVQPTGNSFAGESFSGGSARPNLSVEIKEAQIRPDHHAAFSDQGRYCCPCDLFVKVYLVNTADVSTTVKDASVFVRSSAGTEYRGDFRPLGNGFELVPEVNGFQGALAKVFSSTVPLVGLDLIFNSHVFGRAIGKEGWLRFSLPKVLVDDLETLSKREGGVIVTMTDALGNAHPSPAIRGPWPMAGSVMKKAEWKNQHA